MANGRSNFGFNVTGGGGGLANLVQAPKVTPVRSMSFAPTPQRRIQRDEKDPKKQILGALLGSAAPFAADAALQGIGSLTGLKFFEDEPTAAAARVSDFQAPAPLDPGQGLTPDQLRERVRQQRLSEISDAVPQLPTTPQRKTGLGSIASSILQYAPALAFAGEDDDGSASAFITAANAARKADAAIEAAETKAAIDRSQSRAAAFARIDPKLTQVTVNGAKQIGDSLVRYQTRALRDELGNTWIESRGDPLFDIQQGTSEPVPKGQYYRNTQMTLLDGDLEKVTTDTFQDSGGIADGQLFEVSLVHAPDPNTGAPTLQRRVLRDDGTYSTVQEMNAEGHNLVSEIDTKVDRAVPGRLKTADQKKIDNFNMRKNAGKDLIALTTSIMDRLGMEGARLDEDGNIVGLDESITSDLPKYAANIADVLDRNIRAFGSRMATIYGMNPNDQIAAFDEFIRQNADPDSGILGLADALNNYQAALESDDKNAINRAREFLIDDLLSIKQDVNKNQYDKNSWMSYDRGRLSKYLQDTSFYGAAQIRLAFLMATARGESLSRISDRDVALNLQTMGFEDGNPSVVLDKLGGALFDVINSIDREDAGAATIRKIDRLPQMSIRERESTLADIRDDIGAKYNLDSGEGSNIEALYTATDPKEIGRLRRLVRREIQRNAGGAATQNIVYDPQLQMFLPSTLAREITSGNDPIFAKFNEYMKLLQYNLRTGARPGKRSVTPDRGIPRTSVGDGQGAKAGTRASIFMQNLTEPSQ